MSGDIQLPLVAGAAAAAGLLIGVIAWARRNSKRTFANQAIVGRIEVLRGIGSTRYQVSGRVFPGLDEASDVWRSLGVFEELSDAASALRDYQAPRADDETLFVLVDEGTHDVRPLGRPNESTR